MKEYYNGSDGRIMWIDVYTDDDVKGPYKGEHGAYHIQIQTAYTKIHFRGSHDGGPDYEEEISGWGPSCVDVTLPR